MSAVHVGRRFRRPTMTAVKKHRQRRLFNRKEYELFKKAGAMSSTMKRRKKLLLVAVTSTLVVKHRRKNSFMSRVATHPDFCGTSWFPAQTSRVPTRPPSRCTVSVPIYWHDKSNLRENRLGSSVEVEHAILYSAKVSTVCLLLSNVARFCQTLLTALFDYLLNALRTLHTGVVVLAYYATSSSSSLSFPVCLFSMFTRVKMHCRTHGSHSPVGASQ